MCRICLTLAYDGTDYAGWQVQPGQRTVQGVLERALRPLIGVGEDVRVHASGRTDSGVHALGQVAHVDVPTSRRDLPWQKALNATLPPDVRVVAAREVPATFHARFSAISKTYAYTLWLDPDYVLPQRRRHVWHCGPLDLNALDRAAAFLLGEQDFAAFRNTGTETRSTVRTMHRVWRSSGVHPAECVLRFQASGFLKQMVRNLTGCLVAVGRGKAEPENVRSYLKEGDRSAAPATAPAQGLCLERVEYPDVPFPDGNGDEHQMGSSRAPARG
ncbi:tRNA pseudouridine38-40 synthase [Paucidesulfovibrio gracilis DSM 16080]|uniref:tRNA pseudouridine synthase A n=1 Tax=Paucidesulfovibrio gracilis DSM 16080 TaxID=1121449 RepID=A0A1T4X103_9BACT|nr:tRNA pseudouridine(38-40) synthase TruA [Paucidesulfovibrio gracilis]SKA83236.1 tRNA pseudouridine38-40 synthase [Paucidesulfovibrio gracilis DSM 16080]